MPCLLVLAAIVFPRLTLFFIWLLTTWPKQAFEGWLWPLLGWVIVPWTTLAYMAGMLRNNHHINGFWLVLVIVALIFDVISLSAKDEKK